MRLWEQFVNKPIARKYIDLILQSSSWWATYVPFKAESIRAGDFGFIDPKTGEFQFKGNIYEDKTILEALPDLKKEEYQPKLGSTINKWIITSKNTTQIDATSGPNAHIPGVFQASIDIEVSFQNGRGALLVMYQAQTTELPQNILLESLSKVEKLRDKSIRLVSKVVKCPAYALQISEKGTTSSRVRFFGQLPVPHVPGLTAGGEVVAGWKSEGIASSYQEGWNPEGQYAYCPLYELKKVWHRPPYRQIQRVRKGDETWIDVVPPWIPLDEDGNEIEIDDDDDDDDE